MRMNCDQAICYPIWLRYVALMFVIVLEEDTEERPAGEEADAYAAMTHSREP